MCGILGVLPAIPAAQFEHALGTLAHRGPDGSGTWANADAMLGHRRLAILDLSDNGRQPMADPSGRYVIVFNGEIYNFIEIRQELEDKGYRFRSDSDTEVVIAAFMEWGEDCLHKFNGMWAFAIWDTYEKVLFLSRDRIGEKPLFYATIPGGEFAFASEMKAFFPLLGEIRANKTLVKDARRIFSYEATEECVIEGIKRFPAGHCGWLREGRLATRRWWCTLDHLVQVPQRYEELVEQFRELFLDSCRLRMRSDVPIGTALSGGLDSSATISAMAYLAKDTSAQRMGKSWQHAFVAGFPGTPLDETEYALKVTKHIGINATIININPLDAMERLNDYFYLFEDLYITSPIPFMLTYEAVKAHGISVTLDGHGADELFGGYNFDYILALRDAGWNLKQAYEIVGAYYDGYPIGSKQFVRLPSKTRYIAEHQARHIAKKIMRRSSGQSSRDVGHPAFKELRHLNRQLYISTHETVLPTLLRNYDRYSMANGVEIRMPFLDHRILSFAFSVPWSAKIRGGYSKAIIRDAVAPYMPHDVAYRKTKIGFNSPIIDWMKGALKEFMLDSIYSRSFRECELIDPDRVSGAIRNVIDNPDAKFHEGEQAWTMLMPYLWERAVLKHGEAMA